MKISLRFLPLILSLLSGAFVSAAPLVWQDYTYTTQDQTPLKIAMQTARHTVPDTLTCPWHT